MGEEDPYGVLVYGPSTPYVTPEMLLAAPTGISWSTIGASSGKPTLAEQYVEATNICARATDMADSICNLTLRATVDTEILTGPGAFRFQLQPSGRARLLLSRPPVLSVLGGQWNCAGVFPPQYQSISADMFRVERPIIGTYGTTAPNGSGDGGQAVLLAPGIVTWWYGREQYDVQVTYINGWPHGSLMADATTGDMSIQVDDITGWLGSTGVIHSAGGQESVYVNAVTPSVAGGISGPGALNLSGPLHFQHPTGTLVTTLPGTVTQAVILLCTYQALVRGATATTVMSVPGSRSSTGSTEGLMTAAKALLKPYMRTV